MHHAISRLPGTSTHIPLYPSMLIASHSSSSTHRSAHHQQAPHPSLHNSGSRAVRQHVRSRTLAQHAADAHDSTAAAAVTPAAALHPHHQHLQQHQQQQTAVGPLQLQVQQASHWRHLLQPAADVQHLSELVLLLNAAMQLQPTAAAPAAASLSASQQYNEQQQYVRFLQHLIICARQLLLRAARKAAAAERQELLPLLRVLTQVPPDLRQQLHQLLALPVVNAVEPQLRQLKRTPSQAVQLMVCLAMLRAHLQPMPAQLQQPLFAAALGLAAKPLQSDQQQQPPQQQTQPPDVMAAAQVLWAAVRLKWQPKELHLQQAVCACLPQLHTCDNAGAVAVFVWAVTQLGVTPARLQRWWVASSTEQQLRLQEGSGHDSPSLPLQHPQQQQQQQQLQQQQDPPQQHQHGQHQAHHSKPQQATRVLSAALLRHVSHFSAPELVGVMWAAAALRLLHESQLLRGLLQGLAQPHVLLQLTDEDICSVLWSLARMHQKRAGAVRWVSRRLQAHSQRQVGSARQQQQEAQEQEQEQQQEQKQAQAQQQQDQELSSQGFDEGIQFELQQEVAGVAVDWKLQQQWHAVLQQHWYGSEADDQQQQQQQEQQEDEQQQQHKQQWRQHKRQQRSAEHALLLRQPDLVPPVLVQPLLQAYFVSLPISSGSCISRTLWATSMLRVLPPRDWMAGVLRQLQARCAGPLAGGVGGGLDPTSCILVALALSRLRYLPEAPWLRWFWKASLPFFPREQQQQQVQASADSSSRSSSSNGASADSSSSGTSSSTFTQDELAVLASAAYDLSLLTRPTRPGPWPGQKPPGVWLDALAQSSQGALNPRENLSTLLLWGEVMMRFSSMAGEAWRGPGAAWWQGFEAATEPYLQTAGPRELLRLGKMLSTQQQHQPLGAGWVAAFLRATRSRCLHPAAAAAAAGPVQGSGAAGSVALRPQPQERLSARNLANLGKSAVGLGVVPDRGWLQAWELSLELRGSEMTLGVAKSLQQTQRAFRRLAEQ